MSQRYKTTYVPQNLLYNASHRAGQEPLPPPFWGSIGPFVPQLSLSENNPALFAFSFTLFSTNSRWFIVTCEKRQWLLIPLYFGPNPRKIFVYIYLFQFWDLSIQQTDNHQKSSCSIVALAGLWKYDLKEVFSLSYSVKCSLMLGCTIHWGLEKGCKNAKASWVPDIHHSEMCTFSRSCIWKM